MSPVLQKHQLCATSRVASEHGKGSASMADKAGDSPCPYSAQCGCQVTTGSAALRAHAGPQCSPAGRHQV